MSTRTKTINSMLSWKEVVSRTWKKKTTQAQIIQNLAKLQLSTSVVSLWCFLGIYVSPVPQQS